MARDRLNKITAMHLTASGLGHSKDPEKDKINGSGTPSKKKKGSKESAPSANVKEVPVTSKPKGIK